MIDERDPNVTYKVTHTTIPPLEYSVITYPDFTHDPPMTSGYYTYNTLPAWIQDGINKLDIAGNGTAVPYFGIKRGDTYWFKSIRYSKDSGD